MRRMTSRPTDQSGRRPSEQRLRPPPVPRNHPSSSINQAAAPEPLLRRRSFAPNRPASPSRGPALRPSTSSVRHGPWLRFPCSFLAMSVFGALRTPGNEDFQAKWADWMRNHHATWLVNRAERRYYAHSSAGRRHAEGLAPPCSAPRPASDRAGSATGGGRLTAHHRPCTWWCPVCPVRDSGGRPAPGRRTAGDVRDRSTARRRPHQRAHHTGLDRPDCLATAGWCPGARTRRHVAPAAGHRRVARSRTIVAAFNGGFRSKDAHGGFYAEHHASSPLRDGAASLAIGSRPRSARPVGSRRAHDRRHRERAAEPGPAGRPRPPGPRHRRRQVRDWGATLGNKVYVWRSAIGVDASGGILYAAGPGLRASTLADVLARAGAVRAMTLDINPEWVTFNFFDHPDPAIPSSSMAAS